MVMAPSLSPGSPPPRPHWVASAPVTGRRAAHDQVVGQSPRLEARDDGIPGLELREDRLGGPLTLPERELIDRGQPEELTQLVPVDADDRQVFGHAVAELARCEQRADGHLVGCCEDRARAASWLA